MAAFKSRGFAFFNPQVENWTPELAEAEAWHLANDDIVLFPVTDETFGFGSLAETGFSIQSAVTSSAHRFVVVYISPSVSDALKQLSPEQADASRRARKLALAHLELIDNRMVIRATSLEDMLDKALILKEVQRLMDLVRGKAN